MLTRTATVISLACTFSNLILNNVHAFSPIATSSSPFMSNIQTETSFKMAPLDSDNNSNSNPNPNSVSRRTSLVSGGILLTQILGIPSLAIAAENERKSPDSLDVESFLKSGQVMNPMGVSGQAGKSRPETGVILREGSQVARDSRSGNVLAEILVGPSSDPTAIVTSYQSPWPLASGTVFDVECRDAKTGDGAFLAVTSSTNGKALGEIPTSFFLDQVMKPTGRFSFYGSPTDVKVKKDSMVNEYRFVELTFSNLSQSTQTEIPRNAIIATTIVPGTENAVMLIGSATASRWKKGAGDDVRKIVESFRAVAAPKSKMKIRAQQRNESV